MDKFEIFNSSLMDGASSFHRTQHIEPCGVLPTKSSRRAFVAESATTGTSPFCIAALRRSAAGGDPLYPIDAAAVLERVWFVGLIF